MIDFLDSSIVPTAPGVHEVYLLMPYHKVRHGVLEFSSNQSKLTIGDENEIGCSRVKVSLGPGQCAAAEEETNKEKSLPRQPGRPYLSCFTILIFIPNVCKKYLRVVINLMI